MKYITCILNINGSCKPVNHKPEVFNMFKDALDFDLFFFFFSYIYYNTQIVCKT